MNIHQGWKLLAAFVLVVAGAAIPSWMSRPWLNGAANGLVDAQPATETPQRVQLTPIERDAIRHEMRTMLRSLDRIVHGLADGNAGMMEKAARTSGQAIALDPRLEKKLPPEYARLDRRMHFRFDQLAVVAKGGSLHGDVAVALARITGYCVACHDMFRVEEAP